MSVALQINFFLTLDKLNKYNNAVLYTFLRLQKFWQSNSYMHKV